MCVLVAFHFPWLGALGISCAGHLPGYLRSYPESFLISSALIGLISELVDVLGLMLGDFEFPEGSLSSTFRNGDFGLFISRECSLDFVLGLLIDETSILTLLWSKGSCARWDCIWSSWVISDLNVVAPDLVSWGSGS